MPLRSTGRRRSPGFDVRSDVSQPSSASAVRACSRRPALRARSPGGGEPAALRGRTAASPDAAGLVGFETIGPVLCQPGGLDRVGRLERVVGLDPVPRSHDGPRAPSAAGSGRAWSCSGAPSAPYRSRAGSSRGRGPPGTSRPTPPPRTSAGDAPRGRRSGCRRSASPWRRSPRRATAARPRRWRGPRVRDPPRRVDREVELARPIAGDLSDAVSILVDRDREDGAHPRHVTHVP